MGSQTEIAPRRIPIQERGERRVAGLLEAAAAIFSEVGYEAATMRDIAERAGASIGSLYQFFPNKEVVAQAIKTRYCQELKEVWANLVAVSAKTPTIRLIDQFLNVTIKLSEQHPAIIRLIDAPSSANPATDIKESVRRTARGTVSYAEASDVPEQGTSLCRSYAANDQGIVVALLRKRTF
ncbi:MAG TPA: helix-turn-helix domain-containing protein [Chthoniobacterales bacterium]|nr:helix-turn-helix domain-containing protein [Chthoniobacterales bacterium]